MQKRIIEVLNNNPVSTSHIAKSLELPVYSTTVALIDLSRQKIALKLPSGWICNLSENETKSLEIYENSIKG